MRQNQLIVTVQNQLAGLLAFLLLNITKIPLDSIDEKQCLQYIFTFTIKHRCKTTRANENRSETTNRTNGIRGETTGILTRLTGIFQFFIVVFFFNNRQ